MGNTPLGGSPRPARAKRGLNFNISFGTMPASERTSLFRTKGASPVRLSTETLTQASKATWSVRRESVHDALGQRTVYRVAGPDGAEQTFDEFHDLPEEARQLLEHAPAFFGKAGPPTVASTPQTALRLVDPEREAFVPRDPFAKPGRAGLMPLVVALLAGIFGILAWLVMQGRV
ncbi:MAG: hypothetical protein IPJ41_06475 [Phycisphaerales bacterium]|nr:hypothetical protein [Phycisphaerales bacterium]